MSVTEPTLKVSFVGIDEKETLILRSLMQFMSSSLDLELSFVNPEQSALLMVGVESPEGRLAWERLNHGPARCIACSAERPAHIGEQQWLAIPFRGRGVRELLLEMQSWLQSPAAVAQASSATAARLATATAQAVTAVASAPPPPKPMPSAVPPPRMPVEMISDSAAGSREAGVGEGSVRAFSMLRLLRERPKIAIKGPHLPTLFVDRDRALAYLPELGHDAAEDSFFDWSLEGARLTYGQSDPFASGVLQQGSVISLARLYWLFAMSHSQGELLDGLDTKLAFGLNRWPDFGAMQCTVEERRLAAVMVAAPSTISELAQISALPRDTVVACINCADMLGWLRSAPPNASQRLFGGGLLRDTLSLIRGRLGLAR